MRKSNAEAAQTRKAIVSTAAEELRRAGIAEASLADMMAAAGLTAGGFYKHFRNKEQLVGEALEEAGEHVLASLRDSVASEGFEGAVETYLASAGPSGTDVSTCPFSSLGSEIARAGPETRAKLTRTMEETFSALGDGAATRKSARRRGIFALAALVGTLTLARISSDQELAAEIIETTRERLRKTM